MCAPLLSPGDLALIDEVYATRGLQERLAAEAPGDPRRAFGEEVEASRSNGAVGCQLARCVRSIEQRLAAQEDALERIQARLDSGQAVVNLNVRAPKRAGPYSPPVVRGMALGNRRPLPMAHFLDEKGAADSS